MHTQEKDNYSKTKEEFIYYHSGLKNLNTIFKRELIYCPVLGGKRCTREIVTDRANNYLVKEEKKYVVLNW